VKGLEHHQTIKLPYSGQDNALLFVFFCCILLRGFFLPLLVLRGVSVLYRQTPTLSCSLPSSQTGLSIERESREEEEVSCLDKRTPRAGCGGSLPSGCVGLALLHIQSHTTGVGGQNLPSSHTHTLVFQPHTLSNSFRPSTLCLALPSPPPCGCTLLSLAPK